MKKRNFKSNKGITLIALIITIIVILILVAVTVRTVANSGLFDHAKNATGQWSEKQREESEINIDDVIEEHLREPVPEGVYSVSGLDGKITPTDLFDYEIIGETGNNSGIEGVPTKAVRITRIKPEYCNIAGYNPETEKRDLNDTHYQIIYKGTRISDTLVIPYQVEINKELYKVTEVCLKVAAINNENSSNAFVTYSLPAVNTIIYPNTVEKIISDRIRYGNSSIKQIILSENLKEIENYAFSWCSSLSNITIPASVTSIGNDVFRPCSALTNINIKAPEGSIAGAPWGADNVTITWDYQGE